MDEVQLKIKGKRYWLWRAVDKHGMVLDILVQQRRDQHAAETFLRRVIDATGEQPRVVITDKQSSYPPALRRVLPNVDHRRHKGLNNRAENSYQPTRQRERLMRQFTSAEHAQRFLGPFGAIGANLSLSPTSGPAGSTIGVNGSGFGASEQVNLAVDGGVVMSVTGDGNGNFATSITLSASLALGDHVISATGVNSGHTAFASFTVTSGAQVTPCTDDDDSRPGNGFGDRNHCHTGPPGHRDHGNDNGGHGRGDRGNHGDGNDGEMDD